MRKYFISRLHALTFVFAVLLAQQSLALLEFSIGYHGLATNSSGGNWAVPNMTMSGAFGLTAEFRFEIPLTGFGLGIRYGKLGLDTSSGGATLTMNNDSTAALFSYRFINTGILLGTVLTYGLSNSGSLKNSAATPTGPTGAGSVSHYTAGLEVGIKLPILLAVEAGYGSLQMSSFGSQTLAGAATNVNIAGPYLRASAGFSF